MEITDGKGLKIKPIYHSAQEILSDLIDQTPDKDHAFTEKVLEALKEDRPIRDLLFESGYVSEIRKHLAHAGMYITEMRGADAKEAIIKARDKGVTDEELADMGYIIIFTASILTWFELSDHLEAKGK